VRERGVWIRGHYFSGPNPIFGVYAIWAGLGPLFSRHYSFDHNPGLCVYFRSLNLFPSRAKRAEGTIDASDITATCQALIGSPRMRHISVINRSCIHTHSRGATCQSLIGYWCASEASHVS
jgi:hypothetical protein